MFALINNPAAYAILDKSNITITAATGLCPCGPTVTVAPIMVAVTTASRPGAA